MNEQAPQSLRPDVSAAAEGTRTFGLWATDTGFTTGQSVVTGRVDAMLARHGAHRFVLVTGLGPYALARWTLAITRLALAVLRGRIHTLYLVCSRSGPGFVRDVPAYLVRRAGVRVVVHVHGSDIVALVNRPLARRLLQGCVLVLPSAHLVQPLASLGIDGCQVCENFVGSEPAVPITPAAQPFTVLWNSNIMASKGFFAVADAVRELHERGIALRLVALGAPLGDEVLPRAVCVDRLSALANAPWLDWRGPQSHEKARRALLEADLVCLPSHYSSECQPLALLEAMCAARPVLIADTAALRATVGDYPCTVVDQVNAASVAAAIEQCIAGPAVASAALQAAAASARARFSTRRFDQQMGRLLGLPPTTPVDP